MDIPGYLTTEQAAELLDIKRESVYDFARRLPGFPQSTKVGRTVLWPEDELRAWRVAHPSRKASG